MPAEVLDLISDFLMEHHISPPRSFDSYLERKVQSLQNLRYTCRQLVYLPPNRIAKISTIIHSHESTSSPSFTLRPVVAVVMTHTSESHHTLRYSNPLNSKSISLHTHGLIKDHSFRTVEFLLFRRFLSRTAR